jgi:hypothetical protein
LAHVITCSAQAGGLLAFRKLLAYSSAHVTTCHLFSHSLQLAHVTTCSSTGRRPSRFPETPSLLSCPCDHVLSQGKNLFFPDLSRIPVRNMSQATCRINPSHMPF